MELRFLRLRILIILLVLVGWPGEALHGQNRTYDYDACAGGVLQGSTLMNLTNINAGHREGGTWTIPAPLQISDIYSANPTISGLEFGQTYTLTWSKNKAQVYTFIVSVPFQATDFSLLNANGTEDDVFNAGATHLFTTNPTTGTNYVFFSRDYPDGLVNTEQSGTNSTLNYAVPASGVNEIWGRVTDTNGCISETNRIAVSNDAIVINVEGGGSVCDPDVLGKEYLIVSPYDGTNYDYKWFRNGAEIITADPRIVLIDQYGVYEAVVYDSNTSAELGRSGGVTVANRPLPDIIVSPTGEVALCPGSSVTIDASLSTPPDAGSLPLDYTWFRSGVEIATGDLDFPYTNSTNVNTSGNYEFKIFEENNPFCYKISDPTSLIEPAAHIEAINDGVCAPAYPTLLLEVIGAANDLWTLTLSDGSTHTIHDSDGDGFGSLVITLANQVLVPTSFSISTIGTTSGCDITDFPDATTFNVVPIPNVYTVSLASGTGCEGQSNVISLSGSQSDVFYQLLRNGVEVGGAIQGTGNVLNFPAVTLAGTYTVVGKRVECEQLMNGSVVISTPPLNQVLSPITPVCISNAELTVSATEPDVTYYLVNSLGAVVDSRVGQADGSAVSFTATDIGTYTVDASRGNCSITLNGSFNVLGYPDLTNVDLVPNKTSYCEGAIPTEVNFSLSSSVVGVNYQLQQYNTTNGLYENFLSPVAGTGNPMSPGVWTNIPEGSYRLMAYNNAAGCEVYKHTNNPRVITENYTVVYISPLGNDYCADDSDILLIGNPTNANGSFEVDGNIAGKGVWWDDNGNGTGWLSPSGVIDNHYSGSYTVRYIYLDENGCENVATHTLTVHPEVSSDLSFTTLPSVSCESASPFTLTAYYAGVQVAAADGYFASSGNGIENQADGTAIFDPAIAGSGSHTITYYYTHPSTGCSGSVSQTLQIGTQLTLNGVNSVFCVDDGPQEIYGVPDSGIEEVGHMFIYRITTDAGGNEVRTLVQDNDQSVAPHRMSFNPVVPGSYIAVYQYETGGCLNTVERPFVVEAELDASFVATPTADIADASNIYCLSSGVVNLLPAAGASPGISYSGEIGSGWEQYIRNGNEFHPEIAGVGIHKIFRTVTTANCQDVNELDIEVYDIGVQIVLPAAEFCINNSPIPVTATNLVDNAGVYLANVDSKDASYIFSISSSFPESLYQLDGLGDPVYGHSFTVGEGENVIYLDPTRLRPNAIEDFDIKLFLTFDNRITPGGCLKHIESDNVKIVAVRAVNFGTSDPMEFCQNSAPVILEGRFEGTGVTTGIGYFTGVGINNEIDSGTENNGQAEFDPALVTPSDAHQISYYFDNGNGCISTRTKSFKIQSAPITHYKVIADPASGVYCFEAAPPVMADYGVRMGLEYTQPGVTYYLLLNGNITGQTLAGKADGTGDYFADRVTTDGTYSVRAILDAGAPSAACEDMMSGSVEVRMNYVTGSIEELRHESCGGLNDGYLRLSAGGGTAPYIFTLRDAALATIATSSTGEFSGLEPGTYTVFIEDAVGCDWTSGNITVNAGSSLSLVSSSVIQLTCNGVNNASFTVEADGLSSGNYEFRRDPAAAWVGNGSNTYTFSNLASGTYDVSVRDADNIGCKASETVVIFAEPDAITLDGTPNVTHVGCSQSPVGAIVLRAQGGIGSGSFDYVLYELKPWGDWVPILVKSENIGVDATFTGLYGGEYRVDITDDNGCGPLQIPITIDAAASTPVVQLSGDGIVHVSQPGFSDGSIQIDITGGESPYSIVWTGVDGSGDPIVGLVDGVYRQENLAAGTYKVEVTDDNNCTAELTNLVVDDPLNIYEIVYTKSNPGPCYGSTNGEINLGITGGVLPYQSLTLTNSSGDVLMPHSSGGSFANYNNLPAGNYTAVAIDDRGVSVSEPIELEGPTAPLQLTYTKTDAGCFGGDGSVAFRATGGTPTTGPPNTYTYSIIPTTGTPLSGSLNEGVDITRDLPAGNYQLTVTDAVTCFDAVSFTINAPAQMSIVVEDVQNVKCFGDNDSEISVSVTGRPGGTAFTYVWESGTFDGTNWTWTAIAGQISGTLTGQPAGHYRVTATEVITTCLSVTSGTIPISQPLAPMVVTPAVNNITTCHGDNSGSIVLSVTGGTAPYIIKLGTNEYLWDGLNPYVLSRLSVGTYHIEVVDKLGCNQLITESIIEPELVDVTNIDFGIECEDEDSGYFTASISGGLEASDGSYSYRVVAIRENNNQVYDNTVYSYTPTLAAPEYALSIPNLIAGTYTIRITDANSSDPSACLFEQQFELRNISVTANVIDPACSGQDNGSIELTVTGGSGGYSFNWVDDGSTNPNRYGLAPGNYEVIIGDSKEGCLFTRDWTIAYQNTLSVDEIVSDVTCFGGTNGSITATANGGVAPYNYLWEKYVGTDYVPIINTQTLSNQSIGMYKVTVTDFNGCQISKDAIEIEQPNDFTIDSHTINNHVDCYGGANGSFTVVLDPLLTGNYEYSIDGINWQVSPTFTNLVAGGYQVAMRDLDRPGPGYCAKYDVEDVVITQPSVLAVNLDEITNVSCFNSNDGAIEVTADGGTAAGSYAYQWYRVTGTGNIALTLGSVNPATTLTAGDYRVRVTDDNLCSIWSDVYTVTEPASTPAITVVANNSVTTPGGNDGSITISIAGGTAGYSINWIGPGGYSASGATSIYNLVEGTYTATVLDSKGCSVTRDITVSEPGAALNLSLLSAVNPVLCPVAQPGSIELEATGGTQPYTFTLTKRVGMVVTTGIVSANYITYSGLDAGIYDARVMDDNGVVAEYNGITLVVPDALDLSIVNITDVVCFGGSNGEISFSAGGGTPFDNGTAGDPSDDYHTYVIVSEAGLPSYSGQIDDGDTEVISTLPAGNYSLTVTDSNGCSATTGFTVSQPEDLSISVENMTQVTCNGGNSGAISTIVNGRPGGNLFTYSWEFSTDQLAWNPYAGTSLSISGLGAGWYRVTALETATSCSVTSSDIRINEPAAVSLAIIQDNDITTCHGDNSGSIVLSVSGGTAPYMVKYGTVEEPWSGLNNYVVSGLVAGDYTFEITDALGCTSNAVTGSILEPDLFDVSLTSGIGCDVLVNSGWIELDISGGLELTGAYNYEVRVIRKDNNQVVHSDDYTHTETPVNISDLAQGDYLVYVWDANSTDAIGCRKQFDVSLRNMVVSANVIHPTCDGQDNGSLEAVVTGGSGDFSYTWAGPGTFTSTASLIDDLEPGTYELTVRDNINLCDAALRTYVIDYVNTLAVATNKTDVSCFGGNNGSIIAIPSGGAEPYFYQWQEEATPGNWSPLTNTATLSNRTLGTYRVRVTDANNCQVTSADVVIGQPDDFNVTSITYNRQTVSCAGGSDGSFEVQLSGGSGNFEYSIDAVNWQILPTFDNLAPGSYRISIRDMEQPAPYCPKYEVATATILEAAPVVIALDNQVNVDCFGDDSGALTISATGGTEPYTYQWFVVTGTGNIPLAGETNALVTDLVAGNYFVQVRDDHSCLTTSPVYTITQPASQLVVSEFSNQPVSAYDGNDGRITVAITGGTPGYSIGWTGVDHEGNDVTGSLTQNVVTLNNLKAGVYVATVTDNAGCTDDVTITVSQPGDPLTLSEVRVHPQPCNGATNGSIELTAAGGALPYTFTLIRNPGTEMPVSIVSGNKATYVNLAAGFYTARVRDANGNVFELSSLELTQPAPVEISYFAPTNITCFGAADGNINFSISGGTPHATNGYSYILRPENGTDINGSGDVNISVAGLNPDNYTLRVFDASNVCYAENSFTLTQPDEIILTETITPVSCNGLSDGSIRISVSGGVGGGYTYEWFVKTGPSSWDAIPGSNTAWLQNQAEGWYKVEVTELGGAACTKVSKEFELEEPNVLTATATAFDVNTCPGDNSGRITVVVSGGVAPYVVNYGTGTQYGNGPEFFIEGLVADFYTIVVRDNNGSGCQTVVTATIGEPAEVLSVTTPVVTYSCVLPSAETHSVSFEINGGVGIDNGTNDAFSYHIEVVNLVTSGRKTKMVAATIDQPVLVNLDDLNLGVGNYRLIVTDAQSAASASCAAVVHDFTISRLSVSEIISPVTCSGAADGAIDITVTGGSGSYTYAWEKDGLPMTETSQDLGGLSNGNYSVTITDVGEPGRCPVTRTYTVGNAKTLVVQASVAPVKCFGGNDGAIRITGVANAAPGLSYFWNGSAVAGSNELTGLAAGDYSVEIIDGDGCSISQTFTVIQPNAALSVALSATLDCVDDTRTITAVETGGTGPFTATSFAWSGPGTFTRSVDGRIISDITMGGEFILQVADAYGCRVAESIVIDGAINLTADVTSIDCNTGTGGNIVLNVNGGSGNYSYLWTKDALPFAQTTKDIVNLGAGTYAVTVTDNLQDCDATTKYSVTLNNIVVSQPSAIQIDGNVTNNECYGGAVGRINLHTVTGGTAPYSFIWTTTDGSGLTAGARDQSGLTEGTYTVQVLDGKGCLSSTKSFTVNELPELAFDLVVSDTDCDNKNSIEVTNAAGGSEVAANYQFIWDGPGATVGTPLLKEDLPGGTYTITMVDMGTSARCFLTKTVELTRHLKVSAAVQPESCSGSNNGVIILDVTGGTAPYNFAWDAAPGIVVGDRNQAALPAGTYNVTVTDSRAGGGCPLPLEVVVPLQHNMQLQAAIDHVECFGGSNGAIYVTVLNGSGDHTYQWTKGAFSANTKNIEYLEAGEYTLQVTDNVFGCTVTGVYTVTQPAVPMAITGVNVTDNDCFGDTDGAININVTGGTTPYSYQWTGPGNLSFPTNEDQTNLRGGDYYVSVTDASGCKITNYGPITVNQPATPVTISLVEVTPVTALNEDDGTITVQISGGTGSYTSITWEHDGGDDMTAFANRTYADELAGGTYTIRAMDANSCSAEELEVFVYEPGHALELDIEKQSSGPCFGSANGKIFVTVKGGELPYQSITLSDGTGTLEQLTAVNSAIFNNLAPGDYTVTVVDAFGNNVSQNVAIHEVSAPLSVTVTAITHVDCRGGATGVITARVTGGIPNASGEYRLILSGGPAGTSTEALVLANADHLFDDLPKGTYTVRVIDDSNVLRVAHDENDLQDLFGNNNDFSLTNDCSATVEDLIVRQPEAMVHLSVEPGSEELCAGDAPRLVVSTSGWDFVADGNLEVTLSNGDDFVVTAASQVLTLSTLPENTITTYTITSVTSATDASCLKGVGTGQAIVVRQALPTATLSGNQSICLGANAPLQLNLTGTAPWRVEYSDGTNTFVVNNIMSSPHTISVNPLTTTNYSLVSVEDAHCTGSVSGGATVAVTQPVTVEFSGADSYNEVCGSADFGLAVKFTPTDNGPWQLTYSEVALVNGLPSGTPVEHSIAVSATMLNTDGEYEWTVAPSASTRYRIVSVMSHGCGGIVSGLPVDLMVRDLPAQPEAIVGPDVICQGESATYTIPEIPNVSAYVWIHPDGTVENSTNSLSIHYADDAVGGRLYVYGENPCGDGPLQYLDITVNKLPDTDGIAITGPANICQGSKRVSFMVPAVPYATTYNWTVPDTWNFDGDGGRQILLDIPDEIMNYSGVITVTPENSCGEAVAPITFDINVRPNPLANAGPDVPDHCSSKVELNASAVGAGETGQWLSLPIYGSADPITDVYNPNVTVTGLSQGDVTFLWMVTSAHGCVSYDDVTIRNNQLPVNATADMTTVCNGSTTLRGTPLNSSLNVTGQWTAVWPAGSTASFDNASLPNAVVSNMPVGENRFRWTLNQNGCPSWAEVTVMNRQADAAVINGPVLVPSCGNEVTLTAVAPRADWGTGQWSLLSGYANIETPDSETTVVRNISQGNVVVLWTVTNGQCSNTTSVTIRNDKLTVNAGPDQDICSATTVMEASAIPLLPAGIQGSWHVISGSASFANGNSPTSTVTNLARGENVLEWRLTNSACVSSDRVTITNNMATQATVGAQAFECSDSYILTGNTHVAGEVGYWSVVSGGGSFADASDPVTSVNGMDFGQNIYRWTINNNNKCTSSADLRVNNLQTFVYAGRDTVVCDNTITLRGNPVPAGMNGTWRVVAGAGGATLGILDPTKPHIVVAAGLNQGANTFAWVIENNGCYSEDEVVVINNRPFPVNGGSSYRVVTGSVIDMEATPVGDGMLGTWILQSGGGTIAEPNNPTTRVTELRRGENVFWWVVTNGNCSDYYEVVIVNGDVVEANAGRPQTICTNSTRLEANDAEGAIGSWTVISGTANFENRYDPRTRVSNLSPGENILRWTISYGTSGSSSSSFSDVVITNNRPDEAKAGNDVAFCNDAYQLRGNTPAIIPENMGTPLWTLISGGGDLADPNNPNTMVTNLAKGLNELVYSITKGECISRDTVQIINGLPSVPVAGDDIAICSDSYLLNPNTPTHGTARWRPGSTGGARFEGNTVYDLAQGSNELIYEIYTEWCSLEDVVIITNNKPSASFAGQNRDVCTDTYQLSAEAPLYGHGTWQLVAGSGVIDPAEINIANATVTGLASGSNRFRWTVDNNGCTSTSEVEIRYNFILADAGDEQVICEDFTELRGSNPMQGTGTWGVKGGSGTAVFEDPNDPLTRVTNLDRGENVLTWTITNRNCSDVSEVSIINNKPTLPNAGDDQALCDPRTVLQGNMDVVGQGRWTVRSGSAAFASATHTDAQADPSANISGLTFGPNILRWTIENEGCMLYDDVVIDYNRIDAHAGNDREICANEIVLSAQSPLPGSGSWSVPGGQGGAVFESPTSPNTKVTNLGRGTNTLRWTVWHKGCQTYDDVVVVNQLPSTPYAGNEQVICRDYTTLEATVPTLGSTGYWRVLTGSAEFADETVHNTTVTNLAEGDNIFVWITQKVEGCTLEDQVLIRNNEPSDPYAGANYEEVCSSTFNLKASTPDYGTGIWSFVQGGGNLSDPNNPEATITTLGRGTNVLRWTVSQGHCSKFSELTIVNNTPTISNAGPDIEDCKDVQTLDANVPVYYENAYWERISGYGELDDLNDPKTTVRNLAFGPNEFQWVIEKGSCTSTDRVVIFNMIPDKAFAGSDQLNVCDTYTVLNANDPETGIGQWSVIKGKGSFDNAAQYNTIVRNMGFGENIYRWEVAYGECSTVDEVAIVSHKTEAYAGEDQVVYEPQAVLNANNAGVLDARWLIVGTSTATFTDETFFNTAVYNLSEGINTFGWEINVNGCISYDQVSVDYRPVPDAGFITNVDEGCYPLRVQFTNYSVGGSVYQWSFGDGSTSADRNPVHIYTQPGQYTVQLNAPGPDGMDGVFTKQILVYDHPVADFTVNPTVVYVPGENARFYDLSTDAVSWYWDFGDGHVSTERNPSYQYSEEGVYDVMLTVSNIYGCKDTLIVENAVAAEPQGFVVFPNAFKPRPGNASGQVDPSAEYVVVFKPAYRDVDSFTLEIFNRWGQKIFETKDIDSGWDGMYEGQMAPQAVYVYKATGKYYNGREFRKSGSVLLVR